MERRAPARKVAARIAVALALAGGVLAIHLLGTAETPPAAPAVAAAPAPVPSPEAPEAPRVLTLRVQRGGPPAIPALPFPLQLTSATAREYRKRARYPRWSQPIQDGIDPILRDRQVTAGRSHGPDGEHPTLVVEPKQVSFEAPEAVVIEARLEEGGSPVPAEKIQAEVRAEDETIVAQLELHDDGRAGDPDAGDGVYTARFVPGTGDVPELKGAYLVDVDATTSEGELRNATTGFLYSVPSARLTGHYRDTLVGGNLVVEAEVQVAQRGRFHLEATLAAADGTPIAWAQNAALLEPGRSWIPLTFFGLALRESGRDGPYALASVALSTTGEMPNQKNDLVRHAYVTQSYRASDFSPAPFDDPDLLEAAERMERSEGIDPRRLEVGAP